MSYSNFSRERKIPKKVTTRKSSPMTTNFAKGVSTYKPNDTMGLDELRLAQDARFDRVGEYGTRKGYKKLSNPVGKTTVNSPEEYWHSDIEDATPFVFTAPYAFMLYSVRIRLYRKAGETGYVIPKITVFVNGVEKSSSFINSDIITNDNSAHVEAIFNEGIPIAYQDSVKVVISAQVGDLSILRTTKDDNGMLAVGINSATYSADGVTSVFESNINGIKSVFFVFNGILYWYKPSVIQMARKHRTL